MSGIVSLRGEEIRPPGEPNPDVVELIAKLMTMAESGEIRGIIAVVEHSDEAVSSFTRIKTSFRTVGALYQRAVEMSMEMEDNE